MTRQDQRVGEGATAIQAQGAVTINQGMSPTQMTEIMVALATQLQRFQDDAAKTAQERFAKFREEMLRKFAKPDEANPDAFKDPDFQFLLASAQNSYARTGDDQIGEMLVCLLAERSMQSGRNRTSLILNRAAETVTLLTSEEIAILSVGFVLYYTSGGVANYFAFLQRCNWFIAPFVKDLSASRAPYEYLESLGCISIDSMGARNLRDVIVNQFGGVLSGGFTDEELVAAVSDDTLLSVVRRSVVACVNDPMRIQFNAINQAALDKILVSAAVPQDVKQRLINLSSSSVWDEQKLFGKLRTDLPAFSTLEKVWADSIFQKINLTLLGKALGHANVLRVAPQFQTKLDIWVQ